MLWETDEIVISNVAIANEFAFFLTESATLIGLNTATAEQTVLVQFTSGNVHLQADRGFYVAANENNQLFAYFGDSRQLLPSFPLHANIRRNPSPTPPPGFYLIFTLLSAFGSTILRRTQYPTANRP